MRIAIGVFLFVAVNNLYAQTEETYVYWKSKNPKDTVGVTFESANHRVVVGKINKTNATRSDVNLYFEGEVYHIAMTRGFNHSMIRGKDTIATFVGRSFTIRGTSYSSDQGGTISRGKIRILWVDPKIHKDIHTIAFKVFSTDDPNLDILKLIALYQADYLLRSKQTWWWFSLVILPAFLVLIRSESQPQP